MKQFSIKLDDDNYSILKQISDKNKISIGKIINFLISKYLQDSSGIVNNFLTIERQSTPKNEVKIIQISLTDKEYKILKQRQKIHLHSSMAQEAKYYILNAIYNNKIINQLELNALALTRAEIHKIGVNINQIARAINNREVKEISESLGNDIKILQEKIDEIKDKINNIIENRNIVMS